MSNEKNKKHQWGSMIVMLVLAVIAVVALRVILVVRPDFTTITEGFEQAKNAPKSMKRTDVLVCYQQNGHPYLANLSYGLHDGVTETYGINTEVLPYGIQAGDFVEMTYEVTYSNSEAGSNNTSSTITKVQSCEKITFSQVEEKRLDNPEVNSFAIRRTAGAYPIGLYFFPEEERQNDFLVVPVGAKYYLYTPESDEPQIFDEYRTIEKDVNREKPLRVRVLCNGNVKSEAILNKLYDGTIGRYADVFFVGYEVPYPLTIYHKDTELSHIFSMQKQFVEASEGVKDAFFRITPENKDKLIIPNEVQNVLNTEWNGKDSVIVYSRAEGMTDGVELSYDFNNCLTVYDNGGTLVQGYYLFFVEQEFFEYVSDAQIFKYE